MDQVDARQRCVRQPGDQRCGIVEVQADVLQARLFDRRQRFSHAVDKGLDADEAGRGFAFACAIKFSPPPKPISSWTSLTGMGNSAAIRRELAG